MTKILIDEAVVRRFVYATAMVVDCAQLEDWQIELHDKAGADLAAALADAALDKTQELNKELVEALNLMEKAEQRIDTLSSFADTYARDSARLQLYDARVAARAAIVKATGE